MANNDTLKKTLTVTLVLSLVCSVLVSAAAVFLKDRQDQNKLLDVQGNILSIAGLVDDPRSMTRDEILAKFKDVKPMLVDLSAGDFYKGAELNVKTYDDRAAAKDPKLSETLKGSEDTALIKRREDGCQDLRGRRERQAEDPDPADPWLRPVVHPVRLHGAGR